MNASRELSPRASGPKGERPHRSLSELIAEHKAMQRALIDLLDQIDSLDDYSLTRDLEPYEAEACWDGALDYARDVLRRTQAVEA